jgi:parvulin-like peptidyl-prolyl isomerase
MRFLSLLFCVSILLFSGTLYAEDTVEVVATVNGINLIRPELNQEISKIMPLERNFHGGLSKEKFAEIEKKALQSLVEMELQYQDALAKGMKLSPKELEYEIEQLVVKYPSREIYLDAVKAGGFTDKTMNRFVERNVLSKRIKALEVDQKLKVTDEQILKQYETNKNKYQKPEAYRASLIMVKVPPSSNSEQRAEYKKKIDGLLQKIRKGEDFGDLAAKNSDDMSRIKGGDLGLLHIGQMEKEFEANVMKMKVGEISDVLESLNGYYIVKMNEKKEPRLIPFDEAKEKIRLELTTKEKDRLFDAWMNSIRAKATIVYPTPAKASKG